MKRTSAAALLALAAIVPLLMAPTGGFPSRPTFQKVVVQGANDSCATSTAASGFQILSSSNPRVQWINSTAAANAHIYDTATNATSILYRAVSDTCAATANYLSVTRAATAITDVSFGNATDNPPYNFLGTGTFTANSLISDFGGTSGTLRVNATTVANNALLMLRRNGSEQLTVCNSGTAGQCVVGDSAGDGALRNNGPIRLSTDLGGSTTASLSTAGVFNVKSGGDLTVNGVSACRSDGTNCPVTSQTQSGSGTFSGCSADPGVSVNAARAGNLVTVRITAFTCTSNASTMTLSSALPVGMRPAATVQTAFVSLRDNGAALTGVGIVQIDSSGNLAWGVNSAGTAGFTSSGVKGTTNNVVFSFLTN